MNCETYGKCLCCPGDHITLVLESQRFVVDEKGEGEPFQEEVPKVSTSHV